MICCECSYIEVFIFYEFLKLEVQANCKSLANNMNCFESANNMNLDIIIYYNQIYSQHLLHTHTHTHTRELSRRQRPGANLYRIRDGLNFEWTTRTSTKNQATQRD